MHPHSQNKQDISNRLFRKQKVKCSFFMLIFVCVQIEVWDNGNSMLMLAKCEKIYSNGRSSCKTQNSKQSKLYFVSVFGYIHHISHHLMSLFFFTSFGLDFCRTTQKILIFIKMEYHSHFKWNWSKKFVMKNNTTFCPADKLTILFITFLQDKTLNWLLWQSKQKTVSFEMYMNVSTKNRANFIWGLFCAKKNTKVLRNSVKVKRCQRVLSLKFAHSNFTNIYTTQFKPFSTNLVWCYLHEWEKKLSDLSTI